MIPTSNHNPVNPLAYTRQLYIFWFLHQTTTTALSVLKIICCISFDSYIKPQLVVRLSCWCLVVYLLIPTSNHNTGSSFFDVNALYIFWFLHQTTTLSGMYKSETCCISFDSYIKPQLIRFAMTIIVSCISFDSYIKPQPPVSTSSTGLRCISFDSYIKPQRCLVWPFFWFVVYLLIPTSNHNQEVEKNVAQTLYIFWFLHQTTTRVLSSPPMKSCISFDSYIKPQR